MGSQASHDPFTFLSLLGTVIGAIRSSPSNYAYLSPIPQNIRRWLSKESRSKLEWGSKSRSCSTVTGIFLRRAKWDIDITIFQPSLIQGKRELALRRNLSWQHPILDIFLQFKTHNLLPWAKDNRGSRVAINTVSFVQTLKLYLSRAPSFPTQLLLCLCDASGWCFKTAQRKIETLPVAPLPFPLFYGSFQAPSLSSANTGIHMTQPHPIMVSSCFHPVRFWVLNSLKMSLKIIFPPTSPFSDFAEVLIGFKTSLAKCLPVI